MVGRVAGDKGGAFEVKEEERKKKKGEGERWGGRRGVGGEVGLGWVVRWHAPLFCPFAEDTVASSICKHKEK